MNSSGEILKKLFLTFNKGERDEFIQVAQEYIEREKRKNHHVLAKQLEEALNFESKPASHRNGCTRFKTDIPIPLPEPDELETDFNALKNWQAEFKKRPLKPALQGAQ